MKIRQSKLKIVLNTEQILCKKLRQCGKISLYLVTLVLNIVKIQMILRAGALV